MSYSAPALVREIAVIALVMLAFQAAFYAFDSPLEWRSLGLSFAVIVVVRAVAWVVGRKRVRDHERALGEGGRT